MLVIRKELKVGVAVGASILGIAAVYGLMAVLGSANNKSGESDLAQNSPSGEVSTLEGTTSVPLHIPQGLEGAVAGLPPVEGSANDPFAESLRTDGSANDDKWQVAWNTGRVSNETHSSITNTKSTEAVPDGPIISRLPVQPIQDIGVGNRGSSESTSSVSGGTYIIQPGDTFSKIAGKVYGDRNLYHVIEKANPGINPSRLKINMTINVPAADGIKADRGSFVAEPEVIGAIDSSRQYRVQSGDTLHRIAQKLYGRTAMWQSIYDANTQKIGPDAGKLKIGTTLTLPEAPTRIG